MHSSRLTLLRRIVGLAALGAAGLTTVVLIYGLAPDDRPPGAVGSTTPPPVTVTVTATSPPRPGAGGNGDDSPSIDDILEDLELVNVAFNSPKTLRLSRPVVIRLLLSGRETIEELQAELTELGELEGEQVRASDSMEAHLTGTGFTIEAVTPAVQLVSREARTEWKWEVEPTKAGKRRLHLTLSALIDVGDSEKPYTVRTFERTLVVEVTLRERVETFIEGNWQWLWTALLIPLAGVLLRRRQQHRAPPSGSAPTEPSPH